MHPVLPDCAVVRELLPEYTLSLLGPADAAPIQEHLVTCPACRAEHAELAGVVAILAIVRDTPGCLPLPWTG